MARSMNDTTDIYRAIVVERARWDSAQEFTQIYGPFSTIGAAKRARDHSYTLVSRKVQKLTASCSGYEFDREGILEWVDVDA